MDEETVDVKNEKVGFASQEPDVGRRPSHSGHYAEYVDPPTRSFGVSDDERFLLMGAAALLSLSSVSQGGDTVSFDCETCGRAYKTKNQLVDHKKRTHSNSVKLYDCPKCPKKLKRPSEVTRHLASHTAARPFNCGNCEQKFKYKKDLTEHAHSVHSNDPAYDCSICKKRFGTKSNLAQHVRAHLNVQAEKKDGFPCSICDKQFKYKKSLLNHLVTAHGQNEEAALRCEVCDKLFRTAGSLKSHMRGHGPSRATFVGKD